MSRYNSRRPISTKGKLKRLAFSLLAIVLITLTMPRSRMMVHDYKLGEPWDDLPVIAKDSFPVFKSDEVLAREQDSLRQFYAPYFGKDEEVSQRARQALADSFNAAFSNVPRYYLRHLQDKLTYIYDCGVMEAKEMDRLKATPGKQINIYTQRRLGKYNLQNVFTPKLAYEYIMNEADSVHYRHAMLVTCQMQNFLHPNLVYDEEKSLLQQQEVDSWLIPYMGKPVQVGQKIVDKGQIVDNYIYQALKSIELLEAQKGQSRQQKWGLLAGQTLYATLMVLLLFLYFHQFRSDYTKETRKVLLLFTLCLSFILITFAMDEHDLTSALLIPYCILPIIVRVFFDSRTAFITHLFVILTCAVCMEEPYEFIFIQVVAGLTAIYNMRQLSQRSELFVAVVCVIIASLLAHLCTELMHGHFFDFEESSLWTYASLLCAGGLTLTAYLILIPIERIFGFTSMVTLVELNNTSTPLLHELSEKAPGTHQHSVQVANLAEEAANAIGANSLLARTGALYHDIGKIKSPEYFTENQTSLSPHLGMTCEDSARKIISHVTYGLELAEKHHLPKVLCDFIRTHHGRGKASYFYITQKNKQPNVYVDPAPFTYPGPDPETPEQAILMMADSVEAASHSLKVITKEAITEQTSNIIDHLVHEGRFAHCAITLAEIEKVKETLCKKLLTINHTRIQYPELKEEESQNVQQKG